MSRVTYTDRMTRQSRLTLYLAPDIHRALKIMAAAHGCTMGAVLIGIMTAVTTAPASVGRLVEETVQSAADLERTQRAERTPR